MGFAHLAIGFAAKPAAPKVPLWVLLVASEVLDILFYVFVGFGLERMSDVIVPMPWSHGVFMALAWGVLGGGICALVFHQLRAGVVTGLVVFSHIVLDIIAHDPDIALFFYNSPLLGLGLEWRHTPGGLETFMLRGMIVEVSMLAIGVVIYVFWLRKNKQG